MIRPASLLPVVLLAVPVLAQKVEVKVQDPAQPQRVSITSKFQLDDKTKMLLNGEESDLGARGGRGGRGGLGGLGNGESTVSQQVEFVQGPAGDDYREYKKLAETVSRPGADGEANETKTEGGLQGRKVFLKSDGKGTVEVSEGKGEDAQPLPAPLTRGVPGRLDLSGFAPNGSLAVGEQYDLGKAFAASLRGFVHPVVADRGDSAGGRGGRQGGGRQGGGEEGGGQAGGEGGRGGRQAGGEGGRGGRQTGGQGGQGGRRGGQFPGRSGANTPALQLLSAGKLDVSGKGKLIAVDQRDGEQIATFELQGKLTGKGKSEEFGLQAFGFGNRGGRNRGGQGGQDAGNMDSTVDATYDFKGKVVVNLTGHRVERVALDGQLKLQRHTKASMGDNDVETTADTKGTFSLQAETEPAGK